MPRSDWSRPLPKPIAVGRWKLKILGCLRAYVLALPSHRQTYLGWHGVAGALLEAFRGEDIECVTTVYSLARMLDPAP